VTRIGPGLSDDGEEGWRPEILAHDVTDPACFDRQLTVCAVSRNELIDRRDETT
jgi:hypothetical protein